MPAPSRSYRQSHALNQPIADPHVDQVGLLPVPHDCDMPDINWEDYDDHVDKPPQPPQSSVADTPSSNPTASANSKPLACDRNFDARRLLQRQPSAASEPPSSPSVRREGTSSVQQHGDLAIPRRSSQTPNNPPSKNSQTTNTQQTNEALQTSLQQLWCTLCDVSASSPFNMSQHLKGKKHAAKLKENPTHAPITPQSRPHNQHGQNNLAKTRDARRDIETARAENSRNDRASNNRLQPQSEYDLSIERRTSSDPRKGAQRIADQRRTGGNADGNAEPLSSSATARPEGREERTWNARLSPRPPPGSSEHLISDSRKSGAPSLRSSQSARHQYDTARSNMQHDDGPSTPHTASRESSRSAISHRVEENGRRPRGHELDRRGGQSETMSSSLRKPSSAQWARNESGSSANPDYGRYEAQSTDRVQNLKPIPWSPFSTVYDASKVGKQGARIPQDFLDQNMTMSEWRELRRAVFEKGDDVDKLAFKILAELLLSPTLGVREDALDGLNSAIKKMKNVHYFSKETGSYMRYDGVPEKMWKREPRFVDGDDEWLEAQSNEDKALHLICENLYYMFDQSENYEEMDGKAHFSTFPFRGGVTGVRSGSIRRIDGVGGRRNGDIDAVENDELFREIHSFLLAQKVRPQKPQPNPQN